jgi:predicted transcriptional regulator
MGTTTVRLDDEDDAILDMLASEYGGRSSVIRHALRSLAAERRRQDALRSFLADWDAEVGPVDEHEVNAIVERYDL